MHFSITDVPVWWRSDIPGELLTFHNVLVKCVKNHDGKNKEIDIDNIFNRNLVVGSDILNKSASFFTDFRIQDDGSTRLLLLNNDLEDEDLGIVIQKLLEIEQYRMMMLLGLPICRDVNKKVATINQELHIISEEINKPELKEKDLIQRLSYLLKKLEIFLLSLN